MVDVFIDSNESDWRKEALKKIINGINADTKFEGEGQTFVPIIKSLEFADFAAGDLGIEFKEPGDFVSSFFDKRLFDQAMGLRMNFKEPRIVVNCAYSDLFAPEIIRGFHPNAIRAVIPALIFEYKVQVDFTGARGHDSFYNYMKWYLEKALSGRVVIPKLPVRPSAEPKDHALAMLTCFPGIGEKKALQILSKYKSLKEFINNPQRMLNVKGWGNTTVRKLEAVINNEKNEAWDSDEKDTAVAEEAKPTGIPITKMTETYDHEAETRMTAKWSASSLSTKTPDEIRKEMMRY